MDYDFVRSALSVQVSLLLDLVYVISSIGVRSALALELVGSEGV